MHKNNNICSSVKPTKHLHLSSKAECEGQDKRQQPQCSNHYSEPEKKKEHPDETPFILPGVKPVLELLRSSPTQVDAVFIKKGRKDKSTSEIIDICRKKGIRFNLQDDVSFARFYRGNSQGVLARLFETGFTPFETLLAITPQAPLPLLVALDQVLDPGNAGTIIRTLYALGGAGLFLPKHEGAFLGAGAARASAGAMHKLPISKVTNLAQALDKGKEAGFTIYGAAVGEDSQSVYDIKPQWPAILVLGSEEKGIRPGIVKRCDHMLKIPMLRDFNSINVAQAAAITLAFFSRDNVVSPEI